MLYTAIVFANDKAIKYRNIKGLPKFTRFLDAKFADGWVANIYEKETRQFRMQLKKQ